MKPSGINAHAQCAGNHDATHPNRLVKADWKEQRSAGA